MKFQHIGYVLQTQQTLLTAMPIEADASSSLPRWPQNIRL